MHILFCNWRDTRHPEGGGSEFYVEQMARGLAERGHRVTIAAAAFPGAASDETVDGVRFRRNGAKFGVYAHLFVRLLCGRYGPVDVVVDVQNGLPFFTRWATRKPVVVLLHHVHREQWPVVYPGLVGRIGWWIESRLAPRLYRRSKYVTVSQATRLELIDLGVGRDRIEIVHNGTTPAPGPSAPHSPSPRMCVLGRLVPHKQVEHAIDALADLAGRYPDLTLDIAGDGWWNTRLREHAEARGVAGRIQFHGFVDEATKHRLLAEAWVMVMPSLKEGWGLVVGEAGWHGTPTVAYSSAGGTTESIDHKSTGVLVDTPEELTRAVDEILGDEAWRRFLGEGARTKAASLSWEASQSLFAEVIATAATR
ncbi:MAG: glycosyltransferase family 4 protein [Aeromicrobium sp.]|uniref:glycosyltransferase family 4 protein n=1 Tax=Aeromicrobium sp. TaxID=1871063 RepID=UPI0039E38CAA